MSVEQYKKKNPCWSENLLLIIVEVSFRFRWDWKKLYAANLLNSTVAILSENNLLYLICLLVLSIGKMLTCQTSWMIKSSLFLSRTIPHIICFNVSSKFCEWFNRLQSGESEKFEFIKFPIFSEIVLGHWCSRNTNFSLFFYLIKWIGVTLINRII